MSVVVERPDDVIDTVAKSLAPRTRWYIAIGKSQRLTKTQKLVAWALATFMDELGQCWPSLPGIASRARSDVSTVKRALKQLVEIGWLLREPGGGRHYTTHYAVPEQAQERPGFEEEQEHQERASTGRPKQAQDRSKPAQQYPETGARVRPEVFQEVPQEVLQRKWSISSTLFELKSPKSQRL